MELSSLQKVVGRRKKRAGQGLGSGRGKTSGRGTKGQKARGTIKLSFEGGALPLIKRLPALRGKARNKRFRPKEIGLQLFDISDFPTGATISLESLVKKGIVTPDAHRIGVKLLSSGEVDKAYTVEIPVSKKAKAKIENAGGKVNYPVA